MNYQEFIDSPKSLLIAPAGYGKTYTISECLKYTSGKQLILTHTHAGIASIRNKITVQNISNDKYSVETISSFAQKYVNAYYNGIIPEQDSREYHSFIIEQAASIISTFIIQRVLKATYTGIFVDEYQDCTKAQHTLIIELAKSLPSHILGDPLQGIFDFGGRNQLVDFECDLLEYERFELSTPFRWINVQKQTLANSLVTIRQKLQNGETIDLRSFDCDDFHFIKVCENDIRNPSSKLNKGLNKLATEPSFDSLLILVPTYSEKGILKGNILDRIKIKGLFDFGNKVQLLEAIDDNSFYRNAKKFDQLINGIGRATKKFQRIKKDVLYELFQKGDINNWFNDNGLKSKRDADERLISASICKYLDNFIATPNPLPLKSIIEFFKYELKYKTPRPELFQSIRSALANSAIEQQTIFDSMKIQRNHLRQNGRQIRGKCIGTTLLTKGLEFDTVAIIDAHKFSCPNNLYVALTRCCKKLIVFSEKDVLETFS